MASAVWHAGGRAARKTAELCLQVIEACRHECDFGAAGSPAVGMMLLVTENGELPGSVRACRYFERWEDRAETQDPAAFTAQTPKSGPMTTAGTRAQLEAD